MQVILLDRIRNLGNLGETVNVKPGYGRNFLIPQGKAIPANEANIAVFESRRAELEKKVAAELKAAEQRAAQFAGKIFTLVVRAADEGKLYGSVSEQDIVEHAETQGLALHKSEVVFPNGVIRELGEYDIDLSFHSDVTKTIKIIVASDRSDDDVVDEFDDSDDIDTEFAE